MAVLYIHMNILHTCKYINFFYCLNISGKNPCPGSCGLGARCLVVNHRAQCKCDPGYTGDPFSGCQPVQGKCFRFSITNKHVSNVQVIYIMIIIYHNGVSQFTNFY